MSIGDTTLTVVGNLTDDPDLKWLPSGAAVVAFTVAASRRVWDKESGEWRDGDTLFLRCSAWRHLAEHIGDTCVKGMRVIATGRLSQRDWTDDKGVKRIMTELNVEQFGPSLKYATATVKKAARVGAGVNAPHPGDEHGAKASASGGWGTASSGDDQWSSSGGYACDEPPF